MPDPINLAPSDAPLEERLAAMESALVHAIVKLDAMHAVFEERFEMLNDLSAVMASYLERQTVALEAQSALNDDTRAA